MRSVLHMLSISYRELQTIIDLSPTNSQAFLPFGSSFRYSKPILVSDWSLVRPWLLNSARGVGICVTSSLRISSRSRGASLYTRSTLIYILLSAAFRH